MSTKHFRNFNYSGYHLGHENVHPSPIRQFIFFSIYWSDIGPGINLQFIHWRHIDEYIRVFWDLIFKWEPDQKLLTQYSFPSVCFHFLYQQIFIERLFYVASKGLGAIKYCHCAVMMKPDKFLPLPCLQFKKEDGNLNKSMTLKMWLLKSWPYWVLCHIWSA